MKTITWIFLLLQFLLWCGVKCEKKTLCNDTVPVQCNKYVIAIMQETPSHIAPHLLEQCSARHECNMSIASEECVTVSYWCNIDFPTLEIEKSTNMQFLPKTNAINMMSKDYRTGKYQTPENINCNITFSQPGLKEVKFFLYDFASFANFTEFCLSVSDSSSPPFCSGSQAYYISYGPFNTSKTVLSITLTNNVTKATELSEVRFWFDIQVTTKHVILNELKCHSKPVPLVTEPRSLITSTTEVEYTKPTSTKKPSTGTATTFVVAVSVVGTVLLLAVVTLVVVAVGLLIRSKCHCSSKNSITSGEYADIADENHYHYIDLDTLGMAEKISSREEVDQESWGMILALEETKEAAKDNVMPWKSEMRTPEPVPRKVQNKQCHPEVPPGQLNAECGLAENIKDNYLTFRKVQNKQCHPEVPPGQLNAERGLAENMKDNYLTFREVQNGKCDPEVPLGQLNAECGLTENFADNYLTFRSEDSSATHECESKQSGESQEPCDYLEPIGDRDNLEPVNAVNAEVHAEAGQTGSDEPANEYTSLSATDSTDDGARNDTENAYRRLDNLKGKSQGEIHKHDDRESSASQEPHDYLELIADEEQQDGNEEMSSTYNEYTSLSASEVPEDRSRNNADAYTQLGDIKRKNNDRSCEGRNSSTSQEPPDYLELIADEEPGNIKHENNDRSEERNSSASQEPHDYLELIGDPERLENSETQVHAEQDQENSASASVEK